MPETIEQVTIKNKNLQTIFDVFYNIPLNGNKSRHRTKFINNIEKVFNEFSEDRSKLIEEFSKKDENGNQVKDPRDPSSVILDIETYPNARQDILDIDEEKAFIVVKDKSVLLDIIDNMEIQLSGEKAIIIDNLAEQLED